MKTLAASTPTKIQPAHAATTADVGPVAGSIRIMGVRVGIADHLGWAVAVTAAADHAVVDRRRIELVEPGMSAAPIHYDRGRLDVAGTAALVAAVRASAVRACSARTAR